MLIFGLDEQQRNEIYELEVGLTRLVNVQVEICQKDREGQGLRSVRAIDAGAFSWEGSREGLTPIERSVWPLNDFLAGLFYQQIARSQSRGVMDSGSTRQARRCIGGLDSIQEEYL